MIYENIHGWFDFANIYERQVINATNGSHFVEIGSWLGKSAAFMAERIKEEETDIRFDCIDTFEGSESGIELKTIPDGLNIFAKFQENMKPLKNYYNVFIGESAKLVDLYEDNSLDFVFVDANHEYKFVKQDISLWLPKVKIGGTLAGHDYEFEVEKAVNELLPGAVRNNRSWVYDKIK